MNSRVAKGAASALLILFGATASAAADGTIVLSDSLTATDRRCLTELLRTGHWHTMREFHKEMIAAAVVGRVDLKGTGLRQYIFVITDIGSCGTAGCSMSIGEERGDRRCHEIYSGSGFKQSIEVLRKRDHGYRRLYTPCELHFDGHKYQQIHDECPTINVQR